MLTGWIFEAVQALPRCLALVFGGAALYIGEIDPLVRLVHNNMSNQLAHWSQMYRISALLMPILVLLSIVIAIYAWAMTQQLYWIYGAAVMGAIIGYTMQSIMPTNRTLKDFKNRGNELSQIETKQAKQMLISWVNKHRIRTILSFLAAMCFYVAEKQSL